MRFPRLGRLAGGTGEMRGRLLGETVTTRATARAMASSLENGRLPVALRGSGQACCAVWTAPLSTSPLTGPAPGSC